MTKELRFEPTVRIFRISKNMNRRHFLRTTLLTAAAAPLFMDAAEKASEKPIAFNKPVPGLPTVTSLSSDAVAVVWRVNGPCTGYVEYGPTEALGKVAYGAADGLRPFDSAALAVRITELKPGERLHYRTVTAPIKFPNHYAIKRGEAVASPTFSFTFPGAGEKTRIAVWNDIHQHKDTAAALVKATDAFTPDLLVLNGDIVGDQFNKESDFTESLLGLDNGSELWSKRPVAFVRGNHDARGSIARELPRFAPRPRIDGYHGAYRIGPVAVIQLDTGDDKEGPAVYGDMGDFAAYREAQKFWLEKAIADPAFAEAPFRIVFAHIPLRWKKPEDKGSWCVDGAARWNPVLAKGKIHAVVSGHTHTFWHDEPNAETPFHQVVSGGPNLNGKGNSASCYVRIDADTKELVLRVVEVATGTEKLTLKLKA